MKLNKKHIGKLFDVSGGDGSWWYMLLDIKRGKLLFLDNSGRFWIEESKRDWRLFRGPDLDPDQVKEGWKKARRVE